MHPPAEGDVAGHLVELSLEGEAPVVGQEAQSIVGGEYGVAEAV